ncbi:transport permease protein [Paenibacillus baekrokdamisoli]|uniref:Transport permease protein n=1 Tax=Paenibacillus baekrokdamisoli TaxID=1712516 RepID=A0A3G9J5W8_9BACL|nr:ABC transporter permease [Paenibacillus baekrokdamisoli]MBB3070140.1 ABC-2 type transport system permease protein [Paenibacillus baekrokdamisoli]BBH21151.1 transport permease protein [Paenibacillus baekrokdamisoli]
MRIRALAIRIIIQFIRDKRTLALLFLAPLLILGLMKFVFNGNTVEPQIGIVHVPQVIVERLQQTEAQLTSFNDIESAQKAIKNRDLDAILMLKNDKPAIMLEGSDPATNKMVLMLLQRTLSIQPTFVEPTITYFHGNADMTSFDSFGPVLIGFFSFFFVFMLAGVSFLRERTSGTLERLLTTPIRRSEVVFGYLSGFGLFTLLQAALIAWFSVHVLGLYMDGSIWLVLLMNLLLSLTALTLGTLLSSFANNEFQIIQFIPLVIVPQVFFSGLFNLDAMNPWLQKLGHIMPLYYGADALRAIMIRGEGWSDIQTNIYVLLGFSAVFVMLNILALRKHRAI